jgi:hypothetical protein
VSSAISGPIFWVWYSIQAKEDPNRINLRPDPPKNRVCALPANGGGFGHPHGSMGWSLGPKFFFSFFFFNIFFFFFFFFKKKIIIN